jgi:hypothetical protein
MAQSASRSRCIRSLADSVGRTAAHESALSERDD